MKRRICNHDLDAVDTHVSLAVNAIKAVASISGFVDHGGTVARALGDLAAAREGLRLLKIVNEPNEPHLRRVK